MTFEIPGKPEGKARARTFYNKKIGKMQSITPEKTRSYEDLVRYCFQQAGGKKTVHPVKIKITAFMPIPSSFSKKMGIQALSGMIYPQTKPDNDNIEKVVFDALTGFAYYDDTQIVENTTVKFFSDEPRVIVEIENIDTEFYKCGSKYTKKSGH